jgi:hypothetical protein
MKFLNLIPPNQKNNLNRERHFLLIHGIIGFLVFIVASNAIILTIARFILIEHYTSLKKNNTLVNNEIMLLQNNIIEINKKTDITEKMQSKFIKMSYLINKLSESIPKNATVNYMYFESSEGTFKISGTASSRDALMEAKETLENAPYVIKLESPLSNLLEKENIDFKFSGQIDKTAF